MSDLQRVQFAALSVAMGAKSRTLQGGDVRALKDLAIRILPQDHPLLADVMEFVSGFEFARRNPFAIRDLGVELGRAVEISAMPDVPDAGRADVYG